MEEAMIKFSDRVDQIIRIRMRAVIPGTLQSVKLVGVEPGGIWTEHQGVTNEILKAVGMPVAGRLPLIFLPFSELSLAMLSVEGTALDEKTFGAPSAHADLWARLEW